MIITITVGDDKVLEAVTRGMIKAGYPKNDVLNEPSQVDEGDIVNYLIANLEITADDIEIDRD